MGINEVIIFLYIHHEINMAVNIRSAIKIAIMNPMEDFVMNNIIIIIELKDSNR